MSTFVRTSSRSHLAKSLDKYRRRECKPGITYTKEVVILLLLSRYFIIKTMSTLTYSALFFAS